MIEESRADYGKEILATLSGQLRRLHFKKIIYFQHPLQKGFYAEICRVERWGVRTLQQKNEDLFLWDSTGFRKICGIIFEFAWLMSRGLIMANLPELGRTESDFYRQEIE